MDGLKFDDYTISLVGKKVTFQDDQGYSVPDGEHMVMAHITGEFAGCETVLAYIIDYKGQWRIYGMGEESPYKD